MRFETLFNDVNVTKMSGSKESDISALHYDSRKVAKGSLFAALRGATTDGHDHIGAAIERGASGILAESEAPSNLGTAWAEVPDSRAALSRIAAAFYGHPSRKLKVVGVTGTNGKTTIGFLLDYLLTCSWRRSGLIGTVRYQIADEEIPATHTTPESVDLQALLARMLDADCRSVVMEASSHGAVQHRVADVEFDAMIFTNLSRDHLDYHGTMERYYEAKKLLFEQVAVARGGKKGTLVINGDDTYGRRLLKAYDGRVNTLSYGFGVGCGFQAKGIRCDFRGTTFELHTGGRALLVRTPLIGRFNVYNTLAALGASHVMGLNLREAVANMVKAPQVPGRLESVAESRSFRVYVDYAHTPDALANALKTVRELSPRKLVCVFGCGGNRDVPKRAQMGKVAAELADFSIITSDNPRREEPRAIIDDIVSGYGGDHYRIEEDRKAAIEQAIEMAEGGDIVVIAGKGHESTQQFADHSVSFDDRLVARRVIEALRGKGKEKA